MKKILLEQFVNKTVNFYLDKNEVSRAGDARIKYVDGQGEDIILVVELLNDIRLKRISHRKGDKFGLKYSCSHTKMTPLKGGFYIDKYMPLGKTTFEDYWEDVGTIYNSKLANELATKFCAVSKGGTPVPKRDYSMTGQEPEQTMTEEKKVVRLTERDLNKLVKRVLNEQPRAMGWDEKGEGGLQKPISMEEYIKGLGVNANVKGQSWSINCGFAGCILTLKHSDGKTVKITI